MPQHVGNIQDSLAWNALVEPTVGMIAYKQNDARSNDLNLIIDALNPQGSTRVNLYKGFEYASYGTNDVYSLTIAPSTLNSQGQLVLYVADAGSFRPWDKVSDMNNISNVGGVVSVDRTLNTITLETLDTTLTAAMFPSGTVVGVTGEYYKSRALQPRENMDMIPEFHIQNTQWRTDTAARFRNDNEQTRVVFKGRFWTESNIEFMIQRYLKRYQYDRYYSRYGIVGAGTPQEKCTARGIRQTIIEKNPECYKVLSAYPTEADLWDFIRTYQTVTNNDISKALIYMSTNMRMALQSGVTQPYIYQAGRNNSFDSLVDLGININTYTAAGLTLNYVIGDLFDTPMSRGTNAQNAALIINMEPIQTTDGWTPAVKPVHFGESEYMCAFTQGAFADYSTRQARQDMMAASTEMLYRNGGVVNLDEYRMDIASECADIIIPNGFGLLEVNLFS